jgi:hypothetical protein
MGNSLSPHTTSIHVLDDNSLLNVFNLYRPLFSGEGEYDPHCFRAREYSWNQGRWWYKLAHVCRRWRILILSSASYLHLSLVCTNGTPVANMLARSPSLPLSVEYLGNSGITAKDEKGVMLALKQRDRVRHLHLFLPFRILRKLVMAIDDEFPNLEYLFLEPCAEESTVLMLPETLQAPSLRYLILTGFACPIRSRLHPTAAGLVALDLTIEHASAHFQPSVLLQWISFMPQLEMLVIHFSMPFPNHDVERAKRQLTHTPITTPITLPNLRWLQFNCANDYLETIICRITIPRLERLRIQFFMQPIFSVPRLVQFLNTTESLRFDSVELEFCDERVHMASYLGESGTAAFSIKVSCWHLDWQLSSVAQISNELSQVFSAVDYLFLKHKAHSQSSEEHNGVNRSELRKLLKSFSNVEILFVEDGLVEEVSRCLREEVTHRLQLGEGELPLELLPRLKNLTYFRSDTAGDAFTSFIDARKNAGRPITVVRRGPRPIPVSL